VITIQSIKPIIVKKNRKYKIFLVYNSLSLYIYIFIYLFIYIDIFSWQVKWIDKLKYVTSSTKSNDLNRWMKMSFQFVLSLLIVNIYTTRFHRFLNINNLHRCCLTRLFNTTLRSLLRIRFLSKITSKYVFIWLNKLLLFLRSQLLYP